MIQIFPANPPRTAPRPRRRGGYTLLEVVVALTIMAVMISIPAPLFTRAIEQSRLDVAAANVRAVWCAERLYRLEYGTYTDLDTLAAEKLLDPTLASGGSSYYAYSVSAADGSTMVDSFVVRAIHPDSPRCSGYLTIDQDGRLACSVSYGGTSAMNPSFEAPP
jgi:prepilin-type N-terminal cleavage/methylation domain-containing protein